MAKIVSGNDPRDAGFAFLAGQDRGRAFGLAKNEEQRRTMGLAMEFQEALTRTQLKREQLYQEALERQQKEREAQEMGAALDVQGQQIGQQANAFMMPEGMEGPPTVEQERLMTMLQAGEEIQSPEARKAYYASVEGVLKDMQSAKERQAAEQAIERAGRVGYADPEAESLRLQSGEDPKAISRDLAQRDAEDTRKRAAMKNAAEALTQAQALIQSMPQGTESRKRAEIIFEDYAKSEMDQEREGSAQDFLRQIKTALILEEGEKNRMRQGQIQRAQPGAENPDFQWPETYGAREFPSPMGIGGKTFTSGKADQPRTPAMQQHIDKKKAEKEKRYPGSTKVTGAEPKKLPEGEEGLKKGAEFAREADLVYRESMSAQQAVDALEARGYDVNDPELAAIFRSVVQEIRESASKPRVAGQ